MSQTIPLSALAQYPPHLSDTHTSIDGAGSVATVALRSIDRFDVEHRASLADALLADMLAWSAPPAALAAAEVLREPGSYAVVTGQQAGIATGPLYTLYKAIGAVRQARELEARYPEHRFVAVFWIEADDHDFDEARRITVLDRAKPEASVAAAPYALSRRSVTSDVNSVSIIVSRSDDSSASSASRATMRSPTWRGLASPSSYAIPRARPARSSTVIRRASSKS